jgi:CheY-like chemotaxis protein
MSSDGDARILVVDDVPENVRLLEAVLARLYAEVEADVEVEPVGEFTLKGFQRPVGAFNVVAVRETAAELSHL